MDYPFHSDGCSVVVDLDMKVCCILHDFRYYVGGTAKDRREADAEFRRCIKRYSKWKWLAPIRWFGVRVGGVGWLPTTFRWGYGYQWPKTTTIAKGLYTIESERPRLIGCIEDAMLEQGYRMIGEYHAKPHVQPNDGVVSIPLPLDLGWLVFEKAR